MANLANFYFYGNFDIAVFVNLNNDEFMIDSIHNLACDYLRKTI